VATPASSTVAKAFRVLGLFLDNQELTAVECSRRLDMPRASAHRLLISLERSGAVEAVGGGRYVLSWSMFELGQRARNRERLADACRPVMDLLSARTGLPAVLGVLDNDTVLYLIQVDRSRRHHRQREGSRGPLHATAIGKVLLANAGQEQQERAFAGPLRRYTPFTITQPERLSMDLEQIRALGCGYERQESQYGRACVAAPLTAAPHVQAVIAVSMPLDDEPKLMGRVEAELRGAVEAASDRCGMP
jgi:DNA-binding IclR family transcriptional regulator